MKTLLTPEATDSPAGYAVTAANKAGIAVVEGMSAKARLSTSVTIAIGDFRARIAEVLGK